MLKSFGFQDLYTDEGIKLEQVFMKISLKAAMGRFYCISVIGCAS